MTAPKETNPFQEPSNESLTVSPDQPTTNEIESQLPTLPETFQDISSATENLVERVTPSPAALLQFITAVENVAFIARNSDNHEQLKVLSAFLKNLNKQLRNYDWKQLSDLLWDDHELEAFLRALNKLSHFSQDKIGKNLKETSELVLKGLIDKRFNDPDQQYWHRVLLTIEELAYLAAENLDDSSLSEAVVDLCTGKHSAVAPVGSLPWLSLFLGIYAAHPDMEDLYARATYTNMALSLMAEITNKQEQFNQSNQAYDPYLLQLSFIASIIKAYPELAGGPEEIPKIRALLKHNLREQADNPKIQESHNLSASQIKKQSGQPVPPALMRVAIGSGLYPDRLQNIFNYQRGKHLATERLQQTTPPSTLFMATIDWGVAGEFPYKYSLAFPEELKPLRKIVRADVFFDMIREAVDREKTEKEKATGRPWHIHPFAIRGLRGYIIIDEQKGILSSPQEVARFAEKMLAQNEEMSFKQKELMEGTELLSTLQEHPGVLLYLTNSEFQPKTPLEALVDYLLPEELRIRGLDLLQENAQLRRSVVRSFKQGLTEAGDLYYLIDHWQIPGVITSVHLRYHSEGGFAITFDLANQSDIFSDLQQPQIKLHLTFPATVANVNFLEEAKNFPPDIKIIFERIALALFENSCTGEIPEVDWPEVVESDESRRTRQRPHLKHVPLKTDGTPGNFSETADGAFQELIARMGLRRALEHWVRELEGDTGGLSLEAINRMHHEDNPDCNRNITFSRGHEPISKELRNLPVILKAPENLLGIIE